MIVEPELFTLTEANFCSRLLQYVVINEINAPNVCPTAASTSDSSNDAATNSNEDGDEELKRCAEQKDLTNLLWCCITVANNGKKIIKQFIFHFFNFKIVKFKEFKRRKNIFPTCHFPFTMCLAEISNDGTDFKPFKQNAWQKADIAIIQCPPLHRMSFSKN